MKKDSFVLIFLFLIAFSSLFYIATFSRPRSSSMRGFLPAGFRAEQLPDQTSISAKLFIKTCKQCHDLPSPKMHTPQEWPPVVDRMLARLQGTKMTDNPSGEFFMPDKEEADDIAAYLVFHGFSKNSPLLVDQGASAVLYRERCSECHLLPHPRQHTVREWAQVVERMQDHMRRTQKKGLTAEEKTTLLTFLQERARLQ